MFAIQYSQHVCGRSCKIGAGTYDSHVVEADGGTVHADTEEGHEEPHVKPRAGKTLEDRAGVGLEGALALGHSVPTRKQQKAN